jgi:Zn-dependent membrane protease YugP
MFFDPIYWLVLGLTALISLGASAYLKSVYAKASQVPVSSGLSGAQAAARILQSAGISDVEIVEGQSFLGDHYDPLNRKLVLSPESYEGRSAANVGVAAHECGHALQHQQHYAPLQIRMGAVYATTFASNAVFYVIMASLMFHLISAHLCLWIASLCFGAMIFFQLITLPVEFDASARAKVVLQQLGIVRPGPEADAVNSTLNAAGLTYVAALIGTILTAAYWIMLLLNRSRN